MIFKCIVVSTPHVMFKLVTHSESALFIPSSSDNCDPLILGLSFRQMDVYFSRL